MYQCINLFCKRYPLLFTILYSSFDNDYDENTDAFILLRY